jgi:hypothetical protein
MTAEEWAWFAAYSGKTDRRDAFTAILAKHVSTEVDHACERGLSATTSEQREAAAQEILDRFAIIALPEP